MEIGTTKYLHSIKVENGEGAKIKCELNKRKTSESPMAGTQWSIIHDLQIQMGRIPWHSAHLKQAAAVPK